MYVEPTASSVITQAYLYKWTHLPSGKWYIGSRTSKGCHPSDGYICSSTEVKPLVKENLSEWKRELLVIGNSMYIVNLEANYLKTIDAKNDPMSFNRHNGDGKFTTVGRKEPEDKKIKRVAKLKGKKKPEGFGNKARINRTGMKFNEQWKKNIGLASTGRVQDDNARRKNSLANSGDKNASFSGYCVAPDGTMFDSCIKAASIFNVSRQTIMRWAKQGINQWSFISVKRKK